MSRCDQCMNWQRHYPNDGGICWAAERPNLEGLSVQASSPTGQAAIGDTMAAMFRNGNELVTRYDANCNSFKQK